MNETEARAEAATLCERLRARGDEDSLAAAAMMEGTLDAFAGLVGNQESFRERAARAESNHYSLLDLWAKVPVGIRHAVVHDPKSLAGNAGPGRLTGA